MDALTAATISHPHASKALCADLTPSACTLSGSAPRVKRSVSLIGSSRPIRASSNPSKQRSFSLHRRSSTTPAFDLDQHTLELGFRSLVTPEQKYQVAGAQQMAKEKSMTNVQDAEEILTDQDSNPFKSPSLVGRSLPGMDKNEELMEQEEQKAVSSDESDSANSASPASSTDTPSPPTLSDYPSSQFGTRSISSWKLSTVGKQMGETASDSSSTFGLSRGPRGGAFVGRSLSTNDLNSLLVTKSANKPSIKQKYFSTDSISSDDSSSSASPSKNQPFSPRQFEDALQQFDPIDGVYEGAWEQLEKVVQWKARDQVSSKQKLPSSAAEEVFSPRQFEDAIHQYEPLDSVQHWKEAGKSVDEADGAEKFGPIKNMAAETRAAAHEAPELAPAEDTSLGPDSTPPMSPESNNLDLHLRSAAIALEELQTVLHRPRALSNQVPRSSALPDGFQTLDRTQSPTESFNNSPIVRNWPADQRRSRRSDLVNSLEDGTPLSSASSPSSQSNLGKESPMLRGRSTLRSRDSGNGGKLRKREFGQGLPPASSLVAAAKKESLPIDTEDLEALGTVSKLISRSPSLVGQEGMGDGIGLGLFEVTQSKVEKVEGLGLSKKDMHQVFYDAREALDDQDDGSDIGLAQSDPQDDSTAPAEAPDAGEAATSSPNPQPVGSDAQSVEQYKPSTSKIDHTTSSKKQPKADLSELPSKKKKGSTTIHGRHYNVTGNGNGSSSNSPSASPSTSWSCTTTAANAPKTKSWTSALAASSVPSSPQLLASPTMGSASGSPMLNGTPTMSVPGTPMETQSAFGGDVPVQAQPAATPAYDGATAANDSAPGFQASVATVIAASAIGSLMLIGAIIWAALFRRRRSRRRRHLAGVLEKFGSTSSSDIHSDASSKSSMSMSRSSKDTLVDAEKSGITHLSDEKKMGMGHIGAGIGYGISEFGKTVSSKQPVESKAYFVAQRASARASALNIVSPWTSYEDTASRASQKPDQEIATETDDEEAARNIGLGLLVESDPRNSSRMSRDLARSGLVSEALAPVRDATFSWQHPTLSLPPAAARALATGHYVKKRTTLPAKTRIPVPPMIAPLSSLGASASSILSRAASEGSVVAQKTEACSSSSCIDPELDGDTTMGTFAHSKLSGLPTAISQPALPQRGRSDSSTTAGGSATTTSNNGIASSVVATDGSRNGWLSRMLGGLQSSSSREGLGDSNSASATQSTNGDSGISVSVSDGEFAEVRFVTGRASLGHGSVSPQLQSNNASKTQSKRYSTDPLLAFVNSGVPSQEITKQQARAKVVSSGSIRRNPNWHSSLPACREESEETIFVIGDTPTFGTSKANPSKASALLGRGLGDLIEDTSGSEDERKSGYDAGGETDADSRISNFVPAGKTYKTSNDAIASTTPTQGSHSSFLGPYGVGSHQHRNLLPIRVPSITLTLEDETLGEVERPLSLGSHSESGTTSEEESGTDERIMAMIGRAPAYNPHINPRVGSNVRESTQSAASFFSSNSSDEEDDAEDPYDHSGRTSRAGTRSSRSSQLPQSQSKHQTASSSRASQDSFSVGEKTPRSSSQQKEWSKANTRPDSETDAEGVYVGERYEDEIDLDGYGSESAEGCLELSDFPTLPSWSPAEKAAHEANRADKSAYRSQSIKREKR